ncbi:hypothetical protein DBW_3452 [Desulfuromonas sp. DDH964]|uniref:DUF3943 domain-containing protein n=1 Tax=Desulfuromonas sp. DDH964 TaxID=1823759 RepID=UPI00078C40A6|nr:DUF3943 domain-containing protein [Desulfuromonas sp. DDH964]AMV73750.1 hypothetical protein DBW_3452 [Desulfuromonas sp. DDH964]
MRANLTCLRTLINPLLLLALLLPVPGFAEDATLDSRSQQAAPTAFADEKPRPVLHWGEGDGKSYLVPAADIAGFLFLLNQYDRHFMEDEVYHSSFSSFKENLTGGWVTDSDQFSINQFMHPYAGSMYFGFARSAGLDYWDSLAYTAGGSLLWELAGETSPPSINDEFTTGFGGTILGEPLYRMASLLLESGNGRPGFWRELGATALSPATGINRFAYGKRFKGVFRSNNPAVFTRFQLGVNLTATVKSNVSRNAATDAEAVPQSYREGEPIADFTIGYGLPGKPGYSYTRPFDYFDFQFTAAGSNIFENIISRGLLYGTDYSAGDNYRGVWGLYGMYDYIAPQIFRVSTTALGLGTTGQWWLSERVALQGTALAGVGYGSAGTVRGAGERDYHSGVSPQGLLASRLILADRAAIDLELRDYYVSGLAASESDGSENVIRAVATLTVRVYNLHGITLRYTFSQRDAEYTNLKDTQQTVAAVSLGYTYLGQTRFGAVDWRPQSAGGP